MSDRFTIGLKVRGLGLALAVVRDLRDVRPPVTAEELEQFEIDVLAGFVLARASAGLADGTIRGDVGHLEQMRSWFGRPLWEMEPPDADAYFGKVLRASPSGTRLGRSQALTTYFLFLELRHKVEIHRITGRVIECPIDEMNRPRGSKDAALRIPPSGPEVKTLFAGWGGELATCRKFAPTARNYTTPKLMSQVGLRVSEACKLDLADIKWDLGRFGKLHVRHGTGARGSGPRERMVPLINGADRTLRWFIEDVWGQFDDDHTRPGAPLFPSERRCADGSSGRVGDDALRGGLKAAAMAHLPGWGDKLTPHVLRHFCASELYLGGLDLIAGPATTGSARRCGGRTPPWSGSASTGNSKRPWSTALTPSTLRRSSASTRRPRCATRTLHGPCWGCDRDTRQRGNETLLKPQAPGPVTHSAQRRWW